MNQPAETCVSDDIDDVVRIVHPWNRVARERLALCLKSLCAVAYTHGKWDGAEEIRRMCDTRKLVAGDRT